jgi:hypothetical protein
MLAKALIRALVVGLSSVGTLAILAGVLLAIWQGVRYFRRPLALFT